MMSAASFLSFPFPEANLSIRNSSSWLSGMGPSSSQCAKLVKSPPFSWNMLRKIHAVGDFCLGRPYVGSSSMVHHRVSPALVAVVFGVLVNELQVVSTSRAFHIFWQRSARFPP